MFKKQDLKVALKALAPARSRRWKNFPAAEGVLVSQKDGVLVLSCANADGRATYRLPGVGDARDFSVVASWLMMRGVVKSARAGEELTLEASSFSVFGRSADEFPPAPEGVESGSAPLDAGALGVLAEARAYAPGRGEARPYLHGVSARLDGGRLEVAASDAWRLYMSSAPAPGGTGFEQAVLVAPFACDCVAAAPGSVGRLAVLEGPDCRFARVERGPLTVMARVEPMPCPDYRNAAPPESPVAATFDAGALVALADRMLGELNGPPRAKRVAVACLRGRGGRLEMRRATPLSDMGAWFDAGLGSSVEFAPMGFLTSDLKELCARGGTVSVAPSADGGRATFKIEGGVLPPARVVIAAALASE